MKYLLRQFCQRLKRWFYESFPKQLKELRYVDVTITKDCGGWTDVARYGTQTARMRWKYRIPRGYAETSSCWGIGRFWERKVGFLTFRSKMVSVKIAGHEVDAHCLFGDPWPQHVWDTWKANEVVTS